MFMDSITQIGWHRIRGSRHDLQQPKLVMVGNIIYLCIIFLLLAFACVSQVLTCFLRDKVCRSYRLVATSSLTSHPFTFSPYSLLPHSPIPSTSHPSTLPPFYASNPSPSHPSMHSPTLLPSPHASTLPPSHPSTLSLPHPLTPSPPHPPAC